MAVPEVGANRGQLAGVGELEKEGELGAREAGAGFRRLASLAREGLDPGSEHSNRIVSWDKRQPGGDWCARRWYATRPAPQPQRVAFCSPRPRLTTPVHPT